MPYKEGKKWRGVVIWNGRRYKQKRGFPTKREAKEWEEETRRTLEITEQNQKSGIDLMTLCGKYLKYAERFSIKTYDEKKSLCVAILLEWSENILIENINPEMVFDYLSKQAKIRTANVSNKDRKNLLAMWNWGRKILDINTNPVVKIEKLPHDCKTRYVPSEEDVQRLLVAATREESIFLKCYLLTGARRSEIFRWTWLDDINFETREYRLGTRKTKDGSMKYDWFPMSDDLYDNLWWYWKNRPIKESPHVFVNTRKGKDYGKPFKYRQKFMARLCQKAGIKPFGFHSLRHYVASVLADKDKVSSKTIQRILRHESVHTTERYIQNLNDDLKNTLDLLKYDGK